MLNPKYIWSLTQNFKEYSDIIKNDIKVIENENIGSLCRVFEHENIIYVFFQGTELSIKDLLVDIFFFKKNLGNKMKIHAGFWTAVESIYKEIEKYLFIKFENIIDREMIIAGHSMAGAMAKEFSRRLIDVISINNLKVITFGSPRTGCKHYAEFFDKFDMVEYLMKGDIIGHLPPAIFNYRHTKHIKKIGKLFLFDSHHRYGEYL